MKKLLLITAILLSFSTFSQSTEITNLENDFKSYFQQKNRGYALNTIKKLLKLDPKSAKYYWYRVAVLLDENATDYDLKQVQKDIDVYQELVGIDTKSLRAEILVNLFLNNLTEAQKYYEQAVTLDANFERQNTDLKRRLKQ